MTALRRYHVLGLVGEGGFGRVYKARLEVGGFSKEVAIKLLRDEAAPADVIQRLRDESRILALVRDRAMPAVDPPIRLDGRWAVVMEFVSGQSVARLLRTHGPLPPTVALEVTGEVARVLHKVYTSAGRDGRPLRILHRDLKPDNVQLTPSGEVKVLDFGIARGDFEGREAQTRSAISGTPGYIAPERLEGQEGPEADVFGLGVTLEAMLTGRGPNRRQGRLELDEAPADLRPALALARELADPEPERRPTARAVEERCATLLRSLQGPTLRAWAEVNVTEGGEIGSDEISGKVLAEGGSGPGWGRRLAIGLGLAALLAGPGALLLGGSGAVGLGVGLGWMLGRPPVDAVEAAPSPEPPRSEAPAAPPEEPPTPDPEPAAPAPVGAPAAGPESAPAARPAPRRAPTYAVTFGSDPLGATVEVDGRRVGTTPLPGVALPEGRHTVRMSLGDASATREVEVGPHRPTKILWLGMDRWSLRL